MSTHPWTCAACVEAGRRGTCAPARCYCGHEGCHASASWEPRKAPSITNITERRSDTKRWDERGDNSWIDKL